MSAAMTKAATMSAAAALTTFEVEAPAHMTRLSIAPAR
jgi:hypothetical protein